eukprot:12248-Heterococcus_DN1.PRE.4
MFPAASTTQQVRYEVPHSSEECRLSRYDPPMLKGHRHQLIKGRAMSHVLNTSRSSQKQAQQFKEAQRTEQSIKPRQYTES